MATWRITAPGNMGAHKKGDSYTVITRTTGSPAATDIEEVLYIHGHRGYDGLSWRSSGNWTCTKLNDSISGWEEQHQKYVAAKAAEEGKKQQATGGAQGGAQGGAPAKPLSFKQKLFRVAAATVVNGVLEADKQKKVGALSGAKRALPKPKAVRPKTALPTGSTPAAAGAKKTLLSSNKINSIAKARPKAAASRGGILSQVKTARTTPGGVSIFGKNRPLAKKENGLLGVKKVGAPKPGGMLGAKKAAAAPKKSGGLLGGGVKKSAAAPKKSGGLLGGAKKAAAPKKSGGLLGGGAKKSGGGLLGGAKKLGGGLGRRRR